MLKQDDFPTNIIFTLNFLQPASLVYHLQLLESVSFVDTGIINSPVNICCRKVFVIILPLNRSAHAKVVKCIGSAVFGEETAIDQSKEIILLTVTIVCNHRLLLWPSKAARPRAEESVCWNCLLCCSCWLRHSVWENMEYFFMLLVFVALFPPCRPRNRGH